MSVRTRRLSDQVLILQSITCVREELAMADARGDGWVVMSEIMSRLTSLYACLDTTRLSETIKEADKRGAYENKNSR